jgi:hypothetical protein
MTTRNAITALALTLGYVRGLASDLIAAALIAGEATASAGDWIPSTDAALATFSQNFSDVFSADPVSYGFVTADATAFALVNDAYQTSYATATNPSTRTADTIAQKDTDKNALKPELRRLGNLMQANPAVSDASKAAIGLTIRNPIPTPIVAPTSFPLIDILNATPYNLNLKITDSDAPTTNAKPAGAIACELHVQVSATPITDPTLIKYNGLQTGHLANLQFSSDDVGKTAYIVGRWITRTGLAGPWSSIESMTVAA